MTTPQGMLAKCLRWFEQSNDGEEGCNYRNGDSDKYPGDGQADAEALGIELREFLTRQAAAPQGREALKAETIPWKDDKRQFPLYELAPDLTLIDRDPQADERLKLYRDIFAEITAKAIPICDPTSDDPERVRHYQIPVGPLHRAAGKLGFQLFNGEQYLADAVKEIARLKALTPAVAPDAGAGELRQKITRLTNEFIAPDYVPEETEKFVDEILSYIAPQVDSGREEIARVARVYIDSALRWHEVFDDGRGGNDLTAQQTSDLICKRLALALRPERSGGRG